MAIKLHRQRLLPPLLRHTKRHFSQLPPRPATPLYMLSALSHARETQHFLRSGLSVTHHVPSIEAIQSSEVAPFQQPRQPPVAPPRSGPVRIGPHEAQARQQVAGLVLRGEVTVLRPGRTVLPGQRAEMAMGIVAGEDGVLSARAKARIMVARERDGEDAGKGTTVTKVQEVKMKEDGVKTVEETTTTTVGQEPEVKEKKKYQTFSSEQMQIMLLAAVVALVVVNAYAFETLGAEREAREVLARRLGRIEAWLAQGRAVQVAAAPVVAEAVTAQTAEAVVVPEAVAAENTAVLVGRKPIGQRMAGWVQAAFWAS